MNSPVTFYKWGKGWAGPGASWYSTDLEGKPVNSGRGEVYKQRRVNNFLWLQGCPVLGMLLWVAVWLL